jgi:hypothetical protein
VTSIRPNFELSVIPIPLQAARNSASGSPNESSGPLHPAGLKFGIVKDSIAPFQSQTGPPSGYLNSCRAFTCKEGNIWTY